MPNVMARRAVVGDVDGLLRRAEREPEVPGRERDLRAAVEVPREGLRVAGQTRGLDGAVERLGGLLPDAP